MLRILVVSCKGDGVWYVHILQKEGNEVDWIAARDKDRDTLSGLVPSPIERLSSNSYDLIIFDSSGHGEIANRAAELAPTIGSSKFADKLEHDRIFGLEVMQEAGIKLPEWEQFDSPASAISHIKKTHKRYVFKPFEGDEGGTTTYVAKNDEDMVNYIEKLFGRGTKIKKFVLQEFVEGTEISTEAWFNGEDWVGLNHTLEEKKFMAGGIGPNTGCAGNTVWMPPRSTPVFALGLDKVKDILRKEGYRGMIDLNTIATEGELYGLEWTPRFGYEGTCNLTRLLPVPFGEFMYRVATGQHMDLPPAKHNFSSTIRLSVPPYPHADRSKDKKEIPVAGIDLTKLETFYLADVKYDAETDELVTLGEYNMVGAPIGCADSIKQSFLECEATIAKLNIPNLMYRNDLAECIGRRYETLYRQGWLRPLG